MWDKFIEKTKGNVSLLYLSMITMTFSCIVLILFLLFAFSLHLSVYATNKNGPGTSYSRIRENRRKQYAQTGHPDEPMKFISRKGRLIVDPKGRSKAQYLIDVQTSKNAGSRQSDARWQGRIRNLQNKYLNPANPDAYKHDRPMVFVNKKGNAKVDPKGRSERQYVMERTAAKSEVNRNNYLANREKRVAYFKQRRENLKATKAKEQRGFEIDLNKSPQREHTIDLNKSPPRG